MQIEDKAYRWEVVTSWQEAESKVVVLRMVSQKWRTEQEVDDPYWKHWIRITIPKSVHSSTALMFVRGGKRSDPIPKEVPKELLETSDRNHAVIVDLYDVPNQNIRFFDEKDERFKEEGRREDAIIAYTWKKFIETQDPTWPLRLPMTKAVIKTMDAVSEYLAKEGISIDGYVLTGESKRAWTVWTTAAMDKRVKAIVPVVCDFLNTKELLMHHYRSYGAWSAVFKEYIASNLEHALDSKEFSKLLEIEDPYSYRESIKIPKLMISSTGDMFSVVDALQFYLPGLQGKNYIRFVPNSDHYLYKYDYFSSVYSFFEHFIHHKPFPEIHWDWSQHKMVSLKFDRLPEELYLWSAINEKARDFRKGIIESEWTKIPLNLSKDKKMEIDLKIPQKGWKGYFIEAVFKDDSGKPFSLTTEVFILPKELPFEFKIDLKKEK